MKQLLLALIGIVLVFVLSITGVMVSDKITYARQSAALQSSFERKIQKLAESGKDYVVGYDEDGAISGIFTFRNVDDLNLWVNANKKL